MKGSVLVITLNRPDKFNSFNREMSMLLLSALEKANQDDNVRAVLLTGSGKAFCAGQDLSEAIDENDRELKPLFANITTPSSQLSAICKNLLYVQ